MPRATKKVSPTVADPAPEGENLKVRKGKRRAEDAAEEQAVPSKAPRTVLAKSKHPVINGESASSTSSKAAVVKKVSKSVAVKSKQATSPSDAGSVDTVGATLHCFGQNDCGQLGLENTNIEKRKFPALVPAVKGKKFVQVACGGMHTIALESNGTVWSFGLNDDLALGRPTNEEEDGFKPGQVLLPGKALQISAGDSHSAALTEDGVVYAWGCFKDDNGNYGLVADEGEMCRATPEKLTSRLGVKVKKIASGSHHIAMLGEDGYLYTCGTGSQGQLGRIIEFERKRVTRSMTQGRGGLLSQKETLLTPTLVKVGRNQKFSDIWTGDFSTYCLSENGKDIFVCGLNNYSQLGIKCTGNKNVIAKPTKNNSFRGKEWRQIAAGIHHAVALDEQGKVFTIGRNTDGRLGLGEESRDIEMYDEPQLVGRLEDKNCVRIASGTTTSYAITEEGHLYAWGFGDNFQLATGDEEDRKVPTRCYGKPQTDIDGEVVTVSAGGQHVALTIALPTKD